MQADKGDNIYLVLEHSQHGIPCVCSSSAIFFDDKFHVRKRNAGLIFRNGDLFFCNSFWNADLFFDFRYVDWQLHVHSDFLLVYHYITDVKHDRQVVVKIDHAWFRTGTFMGNAKNDSWQLPCLLYRWSGKGNGDRCTVWSIKCACQITGATSISIEYFEWNMATLCQQKISKPK